VIGRNGAVSAVMLPPVPAVSVSAPLLSVIRYRTNGSTNNGASVK